MSAKEDATPARRSKRGRPSEVDEDEVGLAALAAKSVAASFAAPVAADADVKHTRPAAAITDFERERQLLIQRNRERMMQLKLPDMAAPLGPPEAGKGTAGKPTQRGIKIKRTPAKEEPRELRRSRRAQGMEADPNMSKGINYETRTGEVVLNAEGFVASSVSGEAETTPLHTIQEIPFDSLDGEAETDEAFIGALRTAAGNKGVSSIKPVECVNHTFQLDSNRIRKVVTSAATVLGFAPLPDGHLFLAAGDKEGHIGLWDVDKDDDGEDDGVLHFQPHRQFVCGLAWRDHGNSLYTASYDGSLRHLDVRRGVFELAHYSDENEYSAFDCCAAGHTAYLCDNRGDLRTVDLRASRTGAAVELHQKKINSVHLEPSGKPLLVTASTDTTVAIWDLRKVGGHGAKPLQILPHGKSCHGAFWSPSGDGALVTISFDNSVRLYDRSLSGQSVLLHRINHNNNTGRWILPFKPQWSPAGDAVVVGGMQRTIDMISPELGGIVQSIASEGLTAIPARNVFHPWRPVLAGATNSGRLHIFT